MIERWNSVFELALKAISLFFLFFSVFGLAITWLYLNENDLASEVSGLVSSPHLLALIAVFSVVASLMMFSVFLMVPILMAWLKNDVDVKWKKSINANYSWIIDACIVLAPMVIILLVAMAGGKDASFNTLLFLLAIFLTISYGWLRGGLESTIIVDVIRSYFLTWCVFVAIIALLCLSFSIIIKICSSKISSELWQLVSIVASMLLYSFFVGLSASSKNIRVQFLIASLAMGFFVYGIHSNVTSKVVSYFNVGSFKTTLVVDAKAALGVPDIKEYNSEAVKDVVIFHDVWVVASLSDHLVIKAKEKSNHKYTLPKAVIVGAY